MNGWKVGELAKRTGLTIRTLHHYDEIALLQPSQRTPAGYRLYTEDDVVRLQRIVSLRALGLGLEQVRAALEQPEMSLAHVLELHVRALRRDIASQQRICMRLEQVLEQARQHGHVSADELITTIEWVTMYEKYYTPDQLDALAQRAEQVGAARMEAVQQEWQELFAAVQAEMDRGTDPTAPEVRRLAAKWQALIAEFTGGDPGIRASLERMYREEPAARERAGVDPAMAAYIARALSAPSS